MMSKQTGKRFEQTIRNTLLYYGYWVERFPDKLIYRGPEVPPSSVEGPPDFIAIKNGKAKLVECKAKSLNGSRVYSIPFDRVKPHQLDSLRLFDENGGVGYVAVCWYGRQLSSRDTVMLLIPVGEWVRQLNLDDRKSFSVDRIPSDAGVVRGVWCKGGYWKLKSYSC